MKRRALLFLFGVALFGCQPPEAGPSVLESKGQSNAPVEPIRVREPIEQEAPIALYRERSSVHVGDTWERAKDVFPEPARGAYELRELPAPFQRPFEVHGWETGRGEGYGVITYNGHVVTAMYQLANANQDTVDQFLGFQRSGTGELKPLEVIGKKVHYWFWQTSSQTLMLSTLKVPKGFNLTVAMGDRNALNALGISLNDARHDQNQMDTQEEPAVK